LLVHSSQGPCDKAIVILTAVVLFSIHPCALVTERERANFQCERSCTNNVECDRADLTDFEGERLCIDLERKCDWSRTNLEHEVHERGTCERLTTDVEHERASFDLRTFASVSFCARLLTPPVSSTKSNFDFCFYLSLHCSRRKCVSSHGIC